MVRSILRQVQNFLVLMSVALVVLAFQRLESLEHVVHSGPSSLWPHPPQLDDTHVSEDDGSPDKEVAALRIGSHHELFFGREYHIGLFRFVLPVLKQAKPLFDASYKQQKNIQSSLRVPTKKQPSSKETQQSRVAFVVPIDSCSLDTIDAALVLAHSLRNESDVQLYAILLDDGSTQCSSRLDGYQLVMPTKVFSGADVSCLSKESLSLLISHSLDADIAMYIPLPAIGLPSTTGSNSVSNALSRLVGASDTKSQLRVANQKWHNVSTESVSILMTRPQGNVTIAQLMDSISKHCHAAGSAMDSFSVSGIAPWQSCSRRGESTCHISESLSIATFGDCPMPWIDDNESNGSSDRVECRDLQEQWLKAREFVQAERKIDTQSA